MRQNLCIRESAVILRVVPTLARDLRCLQETWSLRKTKRELNKLRDFSLLHYCPFLFLFNPSFVLLTLVSASIWLLRPENLLILLHQRGRRAGESSRRKESCLIPSSHVWLFCPSQSTNSCLTEEGLCVKSWRLSHFPIVHEGEVCDVCVWGGRVTANLFLCCFFCFFFCMYFVFG